MLYSRGFTLLEMVVVLVLMGIVTSLTLPGLQKMYDGMSASLSRNELRSVMNTLALDVRSEGRPIEFRHYPADAKLLPNAFLERLKPLNVSLELEQPLRITASGFCPEAGIIKVIKGTQEYSLLLRSPDCRIALQ